MGQTQLPGADQVQPGHLQVGQRPQSGGDPGDVQPHHEDERGGQGVSKEGIRG